MRSGAGGSSLPDQRRPRLETLEPDRLLAFADNALIERRGCRLRLGTQLPDEGYHPPLEGADLSKRILPL
jgi:hypothetical protein